MKLYLLSGGLIDADRAVIHPGDDSHRRVTLPCTQVLVQNEGKSVLIDTGMPPAAAGDSSGLKRAFDIELEWLRPMVTPDEQIPEQLAYLDLRIGDLDLVVNTHLHFDHAGGNPLVAGAPIAVQEAELMAARSEYLPVWDAPGLVFQPVMGDWSPLPGVEMLLTPGHTPGHQSMLVRFPDAAPWLFTFDAVYTEEHWRTGKLGAVKDVSSARASVDRLRRIAEAENARLIFGHDIAQWEALGMGRSKRPLAARAG